MLKKALSTAIAFLLVFSLCAGVIFLFMPEAFYSRFYFGSRIIGNISVNIDGREVPVSDCGLRCLLNVSEEQEIGISGNQAVFALIGSIQEETHRCAISYQRKLRSESLASELDEITGIGPKRKNMLLKHFRL